GSQEQFLVSAFAQPEVVSKLELLYTRTYEQLKGVTAKASQDMSRILAEGVAHGKHTKQIDSALTQNIDSLNKTRARTIARTELMNAHTEAALDGYEELGVDELELEVELLTAGDERVCSRCQALAGTIYTVKEARGLIPVHPNCRCVFLPITRRKLGEKK